MKRKYIWLLVILMLVIFISIPFIHLVKTKWNENNIHQATPEGYANDASQLNLTKIDTVIEVANNPEAIKIQLQEILSYAKKNKLKISMAGAQHSMGGHTMYPGGVLLNMLNYNHMDLDTVNNVLSIGSGALWQNAIQYIDRYDRSIAVMQSFSSFSIGGSMSVNGHGWQKKSQPISSSVISFTLMDSNGQIVNCSRDENAELFHLVLGGYGLFGIILDVKLKVVPNIALSYHHIHLSPENYISTYKKFVLENPKVNMAFGRLRISKKHFLEEATIVFFEESETKFERLSQGQQKSMESRRLVFRGSVDSEYGKRLRWDLERGMNKMLKEYVFSRNELLNDHVSLIENKDSLSTDLLQEYFIPENNFNQFVQDIKPILKESPIDLLNITIREVNKDEDSFLNYAQKDMFGFVLLFNQKKTKKQEIEMKELTNKLVDQVVKNGGTFYLPYRLHIEKHKMRLIYPQAEEFFKLKMKYDPNEIFNNKFYQHYK